MKNVFLKRTAAMSFAALPFLAVLFLNSARAALGQEGSTGIYTAHVPITANGDSVSKETLKVCSNVHLWPAVAKDSGLTQTPGRPYWVYVGKTTLTIRCATKTWALANPSLIVGRSPLDEQHKDIDSTSDQSTAGKSANNTVEIKNDLVNAAVQHHDAPWKPLLATVKGSVACSMSWTNDRASAIAGWIASVPEALKWNLEAHHLRWAAVLMFVLIVGLYILYRVASNIVNARRPKMWDWCDRLDTRTILERHFGWKQENGPYQYPIPSWKLNKAPEENTLPAVNTVPRSNVVPIQSEREAIGSMTRNGVAFGDTMPPVTTDLAVASR